MLALSGGGGDKGGTRRTVGGPLQTTGNRSNKMHLTQDSVVGHELLETKETKNEDDATGESEEQPLVLSVDTKDLDGSNGSPEYRGREEGVQRGTFESHGRVDCAYALDVHL